MSTVIAFAAGVGVWYVLTATTSIESFAAIPVAALLIAAMIMLMLKESNQAGLDVGSAAAEMDLYTRLPSHAMAHQFLLREFAAAERGRSLSIVMFSVDNLPQVAATKGASEANRVLFAVGAVMKRHTRGMNMTARMDGTYTFLSVLDSVDERGAAIFAEKVIKDLSAIRAGGRQLDVRVGIAGYDGIVQSAGDLLAKAHDTLTSVRVLANLQIA
ncbi:MAG TPA: diguanylate cyclase [Longimicrobiales bacterium]